MTFLSPKSLFIPVVLLASGAAMAGDAVATAEHSRIVAREDFDVSAKLMPPEILQRRFWNILPSHAKTAKGQDTIVNEPMVREAAVQFDLSDLRAAGDDPLAVSADNLHALKPDPNVPFMVYSAMGRPPFRCLDDFRADKKSYEKWKQEHPNFLGIWAGVEWDNEFIGYVLSGGYGLPKEEDLKGWTKTALNRTRAMKAWCSADRDSAVRGLHECYMGLRRYYFDDPDKMIFLRGAWCTDHCPLDWGTGMVIYETSNTGLYRHQVGLFYVRGAARQYSKPWEWFIATFYNGYEKNGKQSVNNEPNYISTTNSATLNAEEESGPGFGMSVSLKRRDMYLAYLSGASIVAHEDWPRVFCRMEKGNPPKWTLSPHGEAMKEWYDFTKRHPDRGISYVPVALLTPFNQGMPVCGGKPWSFFPAERPDTMIDGFMYTIVPNSQDLPKGKEGGLSNSRYGDIYDVLAANPSSGPVSLAALMNYKVAILLGKHNIDAPLAERLTEYVRQGGTLVINARQVTKHLSAEFLGAKPTGKTLAVVGNVKNLLSNDAVALAEPYDYDQMELSHAKPMWTDDKGGVLASVHEYGRGCVVLTAIDYLMPRKQTSIEGTTIKMPLIELLMGQIVREVLPVEVQGDVEYGLSRVAGGWWLYLINNRGVTKFTKTPDELNPAETVQVTVDMRALRAAKVRELRENKDIVMLPGKNALTIKIGPGDIRVVQITIDQKAATESR